tara:strand:+ start:6918 stop:7724 length:807 start_codon:yes stop_codon:yes gene_type:complete
MNVIKKAKKSLGQNFLVDKNIINKIISVGDISKNKTIMEIGPGYGSLTTSILSLEPKKIIAVEKDRELFSFLKEKFKNLKSVEILNRDILDILNLEILEKNITVFGNLPYNISTKILASLITLNQWPPWYETLIFMFQKEVADRILAKTSSKEYGRLSVLANWRLDIKKHFDISKNSFFPRPKVDSTLLSFKPKKTTKFNLKNPKNLELVTRILFSNRRKMINKSFHKLFKNKKSIIEKFNIDLKKRPGDLKTETYYEIAKVYEDLFN